jgi:hypothetical protein
LTKENGEETRLEELLGEEETVTECRQNNQKLIDFLTKKESLIKLIQYATRDPADPTNKDAAHK